MKEIKPTDEQLFTLDAVASGETVKVKAYAGAGKTSQLRMIAERFSSKRGLYLSFNKDIATDARKKFPRNVTCKTVHSAAYGATERALTARLNLPKEPPHHRAGAKRDGRLRASKRFT